MAAEARYHQYVDLTLKIRYKSTIPEVVHHQQKNLKHLRMTKWKLMTLEESQIMMEKQHTNVYSVKMTKIKLKEKYQDQVQFVSRCGKSDILLLSNVNSILIEAWYQDRKSSLDEEVERIIKTAANLIKIGIKNHEHVTDVYPTTDFIKDKKKFCTKYFKNLYWRTSAGSNKTVISYASHPPQ